MQFARPARVEDALRLLADGGQRILAGGTDFYPGLRDGFVTGPVLDITALRDLRRIGQTEDFWEIGALATWSDILRANVPPAFDGLKAAARDVGSVQIQNRATVVGNICNASPAADGVPPLMALDAIVETVSYSGTRRIPLCRFVVGNRQTDLRADEIVTRILIPKASAHGRSAFVKLGARKYLVISISIVALRLAIHEAGQIGDAAVCVGACSVVARRLPDLERALTGQSISQDLSEAVVKEHLKPLEPIDDVRATADYRLDATFELVRRALKNVAGSFG